jgi:two-component system, LuxR family, sensor kinase FixL
MLRLDQIWEKRHRTPVLLVSGAIILTLAVVDWWTKSYISLGFLYLFPIMLSSGILPRWAIVLLGILCAGLSELFSSLDPAGGYIRLAFEALALIGSGLVVAEMVRNRRLSLEAQESLRILVETSPAAIVTIDDRGFIELANRAAAELMAPRDSHLVGHPIAAFLPELHHALRREEGPQFRTSMQCRGHRDDGESFTADVWFSTYKTESRHKLAAIIADVTDDAQTVSNSVHSGDGDQTPLTERETEVLRYVVQGLANNEIAGSMGISESTVKNTLQQLFARTGVRTRSQLVRVALERYRNLL